MNVVRYKKNRTFHFVYFVFALLLVYLMFQLGAMLQKPSYGFFVVGTKIKSSDVRTYRGIITREEYVYMTEKSGYVNYYVREGKKLRHGSTVYTNDAIGEFAGILAASYQDTECLSDETKEELRTHCFSVSGVKENGDFQHIYSEKKDLAAAVTDAFLYTALDELYDKEEQNALEAVQSEKSGYIMFRYDSMNALTPELITKESFDEHQYTTQIYESGQKRSAGEFAYRIVPNDVFSITFVLDEEDQKRYNNKKTIKICLLKNNIEITGDFSITTASDGTVLGTITMNQFGFAYLSDRYVDFQITDDTVDGYKIPVSAVTEKEFLMIPIAYTKKQDGALYIEKEVEGSDKQDDVSEHKISVYAQVGDYYCIVCDQLQLGDYLVHPTQQGRYLISVMTPLKGVYQVNKGFCIFRQVEILNQSEDGNFYVIKTGSRFGLSMNDRIIQDASYVIENQMVK